MKSTENSWRNAILSPDAILEEVVQNMNASSLKIVMIADEKGCLQGTISDGDIRRGLLKGLGLSSRIDGLIHHGAFVVPPSMGRDMVLQLMIANKIQQIPVVDEEQRIVGLHVWDEITTSPQRSNIMVVMAGGKGIRLRPYTDNCPKPLVKVAGKPMLEHIIEQGKLEGFNHFVIALNYLGHMIEDHFGDGSKWGVKIDYLREKTPLGTVGALSLLSPRPDQPFVVTNGDVVTDIRYGEMLDFHTRHRAAATMAIRTYEWQHPFGVVQIKGAEITGIEEKPIIQSHINAGVYVLSPDTLDELELGATCDMPILFERVRAKQQKTVAYPMHEPWLEIGRPDDLEKANQTKVPDRWM